MHPTLFRILDAHRTVGTAKMLRVGPLWLVHREYLVLVRDLRRPIPDPPPSGSIRWTALTEADAPRVCALDPTVSEAGLRRRLAEGQEGLLGWIGETLAHYRWDTARADRLRDLGMTFRPQEGDVYTSVAFTDPALRGRGLHWMSTIIALRRARDRGFERSITLVAPWNAPALRVARDKACRAVVGTIGRWSIGRWGHSYATGEVQLDPSGDACVHPWTT